MNALKEKKLKEVKEMIAKNVSLQEIKKVKFKGSTPTLNKWIKSVILEDTKKEFFTKEELEYLEYEQETPVKKEEKPVETTVVNQDAKPQAEQEVEVEGLTKDQINALKQLANKEILDFILTSYNQKNQQESEDKVPDLHISKIPSVYMNIQNPVNKNCRVASDIYDNFADICKTNNFTITSVLNFLLDQFCKQNQKK